MTFERRHFGLHVGRVDVGGDKRSFELVVNLMAGGVAVGIGAGPAVVLHGNVQGLRAVADVVSEPAGVKNDGRLDRLRVLAACGVKDPVLAHGGLQPLPDFVGLPGLQADLLRPLAGGEDLGLKVEALMRQRAQCIGEFQIDKVLGSLGGAQFRLGRANASGRARGPGTRSRRWPRACAEKRAHRPAALAPPAC